MKHIKTQRLIILGVALVLGVFLMTVLTSKNSTEAAVGGPTCNVPADYPTIQAAVADPGCTTIKVAAGSYAENVTINRAVNLKGAKAGAPFWSRTFGSPSESKVTGVLPTAVFTVTASKVTIDGFSVTHPTGHLGILVKTAGDDATIKNNILDTIGNNVQANNAVAVYLEHGPDNAKVLRNWINNIESIPSAQGMLVGDSTASNPSLNAQIDANRITDVASTRGTYGIQVNNGASAAPTATGYTIAKIRGNTIKDLSGSWAHAIGLEGETPKAEVKFNSVSNITDIDPAPVNDAVAVFFEANPAFYTSQVNRNNLAVGTQAYGIALHPNLLAIYPPEAGLSVDGECNWWGASNGPGPVGSGSGSKVSPNVDYQPWLKSANLARWCGDKDRHDHDEHWGDWKDHQDDDRRGHDD
jgi:hypothetical protein